MSEPVVWLLLGPRTGDNNQAIALAKALDLPFEVKTLAYNWLQRFSLWLPPTLVAVKPANRPALHPPWPDLIICVGRRSVPVARWVKRQSGGKARIVRIGHPHGQEHLFDLIITTRQYPIPDGNNVLLLPVTMSPFVPLPGPTAEEERWLARLERPIRLVALGGPTKYWRLAAPPILRALDIGSRGTALILPSRRTPPELIDSLRTIASASERARLVEGDFPSYSALLGGADEIFVTGDSLSMLSEAIQAGKKVAIIPLDQDSRGCRKLGPEPRELDKNSHRRDFRRFWDYLVDEGLAGTLDSGAKKPRHIPNPAEQAASAVRKLLGGL